MSGERQLLESILDLNVPYEQRVIMKKFLDDIKKITKLPLVPNNKDWETNKENTIVFRFAQSFDGPFLIYDKKTQSWTGRISNKSTPKKKSATEGKLFNGKTLPFEKIKDVNKFLEEWDKVVTSLIEEPPEKDNSNPMLKSKNPFGGTGASHWS